MVFEFSFPSAYKQLIWPAFRSIRDQVHDEMISLIPLSSRSRSGAIDQREVEGLAWHGDPPSYFIPRQKERNHQGLPTISYPTLARNLPLNRARLRILSLTFPSIPGHVPASGRLTLSFWLTGHGPLDGRCHELAILLLHHLVPGVLTSLVLDLARREINLPNERHRDLRDL